jgi:hypothetical protein
MMLKVALTVIYSVKQDSTSFHRDNVSEYRVLCALDSSSTDTCAMGPQLCEHLPYQAYGLNRWMQ